MWKFLRESEKQDLPVRSVSLDGVAIIAWGGVLPPKKWTRVNSFLFFDYKLRFVRIPQVFCNRERCGAADGYKRFRYIRRWQSVLEAGRGMTGDGSVRF